jgi:hypothetical protein
LIVDVFENFTEVPRESIRVQAHLFGQVSAWADGTEGKGREGAGLKRRAVVGDRDGGGRGRGYGRLQALNGGALEGASERSQKEKEDRLADGGVSDKHGPHYIGFRKWRILLNFTQPPDQIHLVNGTIRKMNDI